MLIYAAAQKPEFVKLDRGQTVWQG